MTEAGILSEITRVLPALENRSVNAGIVEYDNTISGLTGNDVQEVIDELAMGGMGSGGGGAGAGSASELTVNKSNFVGGLSQNATNAQIAFNEIDLALEPAIQTLYVSSREADCSTVNSAMMAITDATSNKRYIINIIEPGTYAGWNHKDYVAVQCVPGVAISSEVDFSLVSNWAKLLGAPIVNTSTMSNLLNSASVVYYDVIDNNGNKRNNLDPPCPIVFRMDGNGTVLSSGYGVGYNWICPRHGEITGWYLFADTIGNLSVDIWKNSYGNFPQTNSDSITAVAQPSLVNQQKSTGSVATWDRLLYPLDMLTIAIEGTPSTITSATLVLFWDGR